MIRKIFIVVFLFFPLMAQAKDYEGRVAIFGLKGGAPVVNALTLDTLKAIRHEFESLGRFIPIPDSHILEKINQYKGLNDSEIFKRVSASLKADIYIVVQMRETGPISLGQMKVFVLNKKYSYLGQVINVKSKVLNNLSLFLQREAVMLHRRMPLYTSAEKTSKKDISLMASGQWNGLKNGETYELADGRKLEVVQLHRYSSYVRISPEGDNSNLEIKAYPDLKPSLKKINNFVDYNISMRYSIDNTLLKGISAEKRFFQGLMVVNMGGNIIMPGYGAYLSTHYMGFTDPKPAPYTTAMAGAVYTAQVFTVPIMTGFKGSFFPWVQDSDKNDHEKRLHTFLWATIPLTFSASFMDQLAYQYNRKQILPPFWGSKDSAAATFSAFIPGGGLFFKGYRGYGWTYFFTEMALAGYMSYEGKWNNKMFWAMLGAVKITEMIHAFFIEPGFEFYNREKQRQKNASIEFTMIPGIDGDDMVYSFAATHVF